MCGIIGIFGKSNAYSLAKKGLESISYRGKDCSGFYREKNLCIGHSLLAIVGHVKQPLSEKGVLSTNCEIYNWKELCEKYSLSAKNDAQAILNLLDKKGIHAIDKLDGDYAVSYYQEGVLYLARDLIGIKPLWYTSSVGFAFASEKKALEKLGYVDIHELNPRKILAYDTKNNKISFIDRDFFSITPLLKEKVDEIVNNLDSLLTEAVRKRIPKRKFGILFSGGLDSTVLALLFKKLGCKFKCYLSILDDPGFKEPQDLSFSLEIAKKYDFDIEVVKIPLSRAEKDLKEIIPLVEDYNVVKTGVALTFFAACRKAKKDGCKVIFSGLGSEEIFAGYQRHKDSYDVNKECVSGLLKMYERDTYRDDVITMYNGLELRVPFLDKKLIEYSLRIPPKYKIVDGQEKHVLRLLAKKLGLADKFALRPKKAAQYGSNLHKAIKKLAKKKGFKLMADYLRTFYPSHNLKLGALVSSGKDSIYAMHVMLKQNYSISCMITIKSRNPDSFMFHTPAIDLVKLQSESIEIPLIEQETAGEKEVELKDLKKALSRAKKEFGIEGVITGALYSSYQRDRVEKICDSLQLKIFSPLWHVDQETLMNEIIESGFKFIIVKVAALGLDKSWLGKEMDKQDIGKLVELDKKIGLNVAFEGGEAESLMIDGPIFSRPIKIKKSKKVMENEFTGVLDILDAVLED